MNCIAFSFPRCSDANLTSTTFFCLDCGASPSTTEESKQKKKFDAIYESDNCKYCMVLPLANVYCCACSLMCGGKWSEMKKEMASNDLVVKPCVLCNSILWVVYQFQDVDLPQRDSELFHHSHGQERGGNNPIHADPDDSLNSLNFSGIGREVSIDATSLDQSYHGKDVTTETRCCRTTLTIWNRTKYGLIVIHKTDLNALQVKDFSGELSVKGKSAAVGVKRSAMKAKTSRTQINPGQTAEILSRTDVIYLSIARISTDRKSLVIMTEEMHVKAGSFVTIHPSLLLKTVSVVPI
jgi:hypothetical protein